MTAKISGRNKLQGKITEIEMGDILAEVIRTSR